MGACRSSSTSKKKTFTRQKCFLCLLVLFLILLSTSSPQLTSLAQEPFTPGEPPLAPPSGNTAQPSRLAPALLNTESLVYLPLIQVPSRFLVYPQYRAESQKFYQQQYLIAEPPLDGWTGSQAACDPGTTNTEFRAAVLQRINYFRSMAGLPNTVTLSETSNQNAQAAALMMSANSNLSHDPPNSWDCYSEAGHSGASSANLALGWYGWNVIDGYMKDPGDGNYAVGHRRWILYPQTREMGSGDIPYGNGYPSSNALVVFDSHLWEPRPATREAFVAWPPPGYVPYTVIYGRWSFAYPGANFNSATVRMSSEGRSIPIVQSPPVNGYGENTLVWIPDGRGNGETWPQPPRDTAFTVAILNVLINGSPRSFAYTVIIFDPG
jgi:uncharacterized protein YkwD